MLCKLKGRSQPTLWLPPGANLAFTPQNCSPLDGWTVNVVAVPVDVVPVVIGGNDLVGPDAVLDDPEVHALVGEGAEAAVGDEADVHARVGLPHVLEDEAVEVLVVGVGVVDVVAVAREVVDIDVVDVGGGGVEDAVTLAADGEGVGRGGGARREPLQPLDVRLGDGLHSANGKRIALNDLLMD